MRVATRLVLGTVAILLFAVVVLVTASRASLRRDLERRLQAELEREAVLIQEAVPQTPSAWPRMVGRWAADRWHRVTLLDARGRVVADSRVPQAQLGVLGTLAELPEIRAALEGRVGVDRRAEGVEPPLLYVAVPGVPIVRVAAGLGELDVVLSQSRRAMRWAALLSVALGTLLAFFAGRALAGPLVRIADTARAIPGGAIPRFPRSGIPEIDQLSLALREMHHQLTERGATLREKRAESGVLVDAMVEGVLASDERGRVATANPAARRLLGYGAGDPIPDLPELFRSKAAREVVDSVMRGETVEEREIELDGRIITMNARPLPSGGAVIVLHDLTQLRRLEMVRRDFIANVSHELKTPLTSISGYAETLLDQDPDPETRRRFLNTILSNARRMQQLVDDQLDLSRIESGGWQPRPVSVDLATVAREVWASRTGRLAAEGVTLAVESEAGGIPLQADPEAVRQILGNLFDNALRYTAPGGHITCRAVGEGDGVSVAVEDTGSGIGREHLPRVFERYYRADAARSREEGGTGLGLAIVKHLVEAHGGRVSAESELGRGTTIRCWFPQPVIPSGARDPSRRSG